MVSSCGGIGFAVDIPLYVTSMSLGPPLFKCFIYHGKPIWRELPGWNGKGVNRIHVKLVKFWCLAAFPRIVKL